ncbi:MAG TPA: DUF1206 domain-containing protein [Pyrinomonadaceae bacterium]
MAKTTQATKKVKKKAEAAIDEVAANPWMERLARFGYATKGIVFIVVGALATLTAFGLGGETTDTRGALREIENKPFGKVALATVAFGLIGYVLWRWVQAVADVERKGKKLKGLAVRFGYFASGTVYAGLALTAAKILIDVDEPDSSSDKEEQWLARLLALPFGYWLALIIGASVIGFGLYQIYKGVRAKFLKRLKLGAQGSNTEAWARWSGRIGYASRGVLFCVIGFFIIQAARHFNPVEAKGLDQALATLAQNRYGSWTLGTVSIGLIIYGFYMLVEARSHRM